MSRAIDCCYQNDTVSVVVSAVSQSVVVKPSLRMFVCLTGSMVIEERSMPIYHHQFSPLLKAGCWFVGWGDLNTGWDGTAVGVVGWGVYWLRHWRSEKMESPLADCWNVQSYRMNGKYITLEKSVRNFSLLNELLRSYMLVDAITASKSCLFSDINILGIHHDWSRGWLAAVAVAVAAELRIGLELALAGLELNHVVTRLSLSSVDRYPMGLSSPSLAHYWVIYSNLLKIAIFSGWTTS